MRSYGKLVDTIETPTYPIFVYANAAGGRTYVSGEVGQVLWDTSLNDPELHNVIMAYEVMYTRQDEQLRKQNMPPPYSK